MMRTWLRALSKQWFGTKTLRREGRRKVRAVRPRLEALEDRLAPAQLTVTSLLDPATLTAGTLRYAVQQANADAANGTSDTIVFNTTQMGGNTITLQQGQLELATGSGTITINGGGQVAISGNNASSIFQVDKGAQVVLTGLTLEGGAGNVVQTGKTAAINGAPTPVTYSNGGAINNAGTLTVSQSTLTGNVAAGLYSYGGAIYNSGALTLTASTLSGNAAADAAGWGGGGAIYNAGTLNVTNSTLVNNVVTNVSTVTGLGTSPQAGGGGGIDNLGTLTVADATLAGNSAITGGGIDNTSPGKLTLQNSIVATNVASTGPDVSGAATGNNNLIGQSGGLSGISNHDAGHDLVGTSTSPLNPLLSPLGNYGGPVPTLALLSGSPAIRAGAAISGITTDQRGSPRPATPDIGAFQTQFVASFAVSAPTSVIAGASFPVTVTALDQYGNPVTNYNGTVTLASSDKQTVYVSASSISLANGTATVALTLNTPNGVTLTATAGTLKGTSGTITVSPAVAAFVVSTPTAAMAGTGFAVTITAVDRFGNAVAGYNGPVTLASSDGQTIYGLPASITLSGGSAQVTATLDKAATNPVTLMASAGSVVGSSAAITVSPAAATLFAVTAPGTAGAGESFNVTLTAKDAYGNVATNYSGAVTLTSSDHQAVTMNPTTLVWNNGTATATVTLNNPNPITLTATAGSVSGSSGLVIESTASEAISNGLAALVSWAASQPFPLVGTATSIQNALQLGLLNPINAYLAKNTPSSPGFLTLLQGLSAQLGNLTVTVAPGSVQETTSGNKVMFSLDFQAAQTAATSLQSLGAQADQLGIRLDPATKVSVTTSLNFNFTFGVDQTPGLTPAQAFFVNAPAGGLSASVAINAANINSNIAIGFLGAQTSNGTIQLSAQAANAASLSNLTISGLQNLTLNTAGSLNVVLPVQAQLGTQSASGTLTISDANLASGAAPTVGWTGFAGWQNFTTVGPDAVMGLLNQLGSQLGQLGAQLWSTNLPFVNSLSLAQAANLTQAFQTEVTSRLASWNATAQRTVPHFNTAQDLANLLSQVLDLSPSQIGVQFNTTTNALTYNISLTSYTFSNLLSQALQVNLNQGGLANASLGSSQLSLVPKITANLTFGVSLTPLGQGFVLTPSTPLSTLNGGAGVRINGSSPDLQITLTDGTSFQVSLAGAKTVQDVINDIETASNGKVVVTIDPNSQQALDVAQVSPAPGGGSQTFTIAAINSSYAAADLGIAGSDVTGTGTITGQSLSGDSLQKHFFIRNATLQASVVGTASQVNATADLGAVALQMVNGTGSLQVQGSMTIPSATLMSFIPIGQLNNQAGQEATTAARLIAQAAGLLPFNSPAQAALAQAQQLLQAAATVANNSAAEAALTQAQNNLAANDPAQAPLAQAQQALSARNGYLTQRDQLLTQLTTSAVSGSAQLTLPLKLAVPITGVTLPSGAKVAVNWTDITNPGTLTVTVTPALNLSNLTIQPVLQGLQNVATFVQNAGASLLSGQLPGLGTSLAGVVNPAALLSTAVNSLNLNVPTTIDQLASQLSTALGQPVSVSFINNVLTLNLKYNFAATQNATLGFKLSPTLGSIADVNGSDPLSLTVNGSASLGLAIDFTQPSNPQFYLQDTSKISVGALVNASGIAFNASVGPLGISISGGTVRLDNGTAGQPATWTVGLIPNLTNHLWSLASAPSETTNAIVGQVNIVLPTFFPTPGQPLDPTTPAIQLRVTSLANPGSTTTLILPNMSSALSSVNLNTIMNQVVDGWDGLMRELQSALTGQINTAQIPVIGTQLQQALGFLQTMDSQVTGLLENAPQLAPQTVQDALYQALGPGGLGWLVNLSPGGAVTENNYVQMQQSSGAVHYYVQLHEGLTSLSIPLGVNLGLNGLGLNVNGSLNLNAGFDASLGFGLSQQYGFYVDTTDTAAVDFNAQLVSSASSLATATLGFLQFDVTNNALQTPLLSGSLSLGLNDVNGTGRLSLDDLASASAYTISLNASANVNWHLNAAIGGNTNLPQLSTDFTFVWSTNPTTANPDQLGFSNVTLNLGGFINNIAGQIGQILQPIEPFAQVLTAPLPVISQLAGQNFDLVDLASALGFCSPSTRDFINAVGTFISAFDGGGGLSVPGSIDLGSFTLDPTAAENPSALGSLNPTTTDIINSDTTDPVPGFQIPILANPASAFQLLLGKDVPLITYVTPQLNLNFGFDEFFPIIGPLGADLAGQLGAQAQFGFGFDTAGFRQYAADNFRDPSLILNGFYVSDRANPDGTGPVTPQVQLYGSIAAYAAVDLGVLEAGVGGGIFATVGFTVHDPSGTGKVHLDELSADVQKGTIFDASGALQAFLNAFVKIDLGFFSKTWNFNIATVTLAQIGEPAPSTPPVPQLTTQTGGDLRLNIGPYASQRLYGNTADGNETLTVTPGPNPNSVYVSGFGVTNQEYDNVTQITGEGAAGNDTITINAGSNINVNLAVGRGTNKIDVQSAGNVTLTGGAGNDTLEVDNATSANLIGGSGTETLIVTGSEPATLQAGSGTDALYGGTGAGQLLYGGSGTDLLVAGSGANQVLHGGSGTSTLVGGSGAGQQLFGDTSTANIFGGTGSNQALTAGTGNDHLYAGEADGQILIGGSGNDVLQVGWHLPNAGATISFNNLPVGATDPTNKNQALQVGWHLQENLTASGWTVMNYTPGDTNQGAGHAYVMQAGTGNTLIIGGWGDDAIYGGSGNDTLYGGGGNGNKVLYAGVGATQMYGGGPGDNVSPSTGTHTLYGGSGNDVLYGGDGCNIAVNPTGTGLVTAAGDSGDNGVNILAAGSGNTTLYSDSAGNHENTLIAGSGLDKLYAGGTSGDYLEAGSGVDSLYGGTGNDVFQLPFIPAGQQAATPDTLVGGYGLTTLLLKPVETELLNGQLTQVSLTTDSDIYLNSVAGTPNQFTATLHDLDSGNLVGQVNFTMPSSVQRIALMGGLGDNQIAVDPSIQRGTFLYGGAGHNILKAGSGNDTLVGGSGTSILQGGSGNDVLYGGAIPAVYQQLISTLGAASGGSGSSGAPTSNALMTWLRQQPTGHNYLIAGSGNSQLYAGDGGDLLIGGNAHFNPQTGQFVLDPGASRDVFGGGKGNDLMIGGLGGAGDAMLAGSGNDVLIGGNGENVLEGGSGSDVLIGGSLINILMSDSAASATSCLLGGTGLNFEFAGAGNDQLFDYSNPSDPAQASAWSQAQALANQYHVVLPQPATTTSVNPGQAYQDLLNAQNRLSAEFALLNTIYLHPTQIGTLTSGSNTISNLYYTQQTGTTTGGSNVVTGLTTNQLINGEIVTGTGIPAGTTLTVPVDAQGNPIPGQIVLSNVVTSTGTNNVPLTFSDPIVVAPVWETGSVRSGSSTVTGLAEPIALAGYTTKGSATITGLASTASLAVGDTVSGTGIPAGATIAQILGDNHSILLSQRATATSSTPVLLTVSKHLMVGQPVTGPGIPAGTTIASIVSGTSVTLSNKATASATGAALCFGSLPFAGPLVSAVNGLPAGDSVASVVSGSSVALAQNATQTATGVALTFTLTPQEEQQREALNNALQNIALAEANELKHLGANSVVDFLQGGSGTNNLYAGPDPVWMYGGSQGAHTFCITPANYTSFANNLDTIQGGSLANDTLMFLGDGNIHLAYNTAQNADVVTVKNATYNGSLSWVEGNNISTVGVQTLGGNDTVTIDSPKFGSWTSTIRVVDGGVPGNPALQGNVVIDATAFTEQGVFLGGAGSDTIKIDRLAYGSVVRGGTGNNQYNELDVLGDSGGGQVVEGIDPLTGQENLQTYGGTWVGAANFQKLVVVGGSAPDGTTVTNQVQTNGNLIPNAVLEGGDGTNVTNELTAYGGSNTLIGGGGTNTMTVAGGTSTLFGGAGPNTYYLNGAGTYNVVGGAGSNALVIDCQSSGDDVYLYQGGSTITAGGTVSGNAFNMNALNMNSVDVYGSEAGYDTLAAWGMTMGVNLTGYGYGNSLYGGAGNDTLMCLPDANGNVGWDKLYAGNNSDRLYVSGDYSSYYGTGGNSLVYRAQPGDKIAIYAHGLLLNGQIESSTYSNGEPYTYVTGTYIPFNYITGIGTVEIDDPTGTATYHFAQEWEVPAIYTWTYIYNSNGSPEYGLLGSSSWTISGSGGASYNFNEPTYLSPGFGETAYWNWTTNNATVSSTPYSWIYSSGWPNWATTFNLDMQGTVGSSALFGLINYSGSVNVSISVYGYPIDLYWSHDDSYYGVWQNPPNVVITSGPNAPSPPSSPQAGASNAQAVLNADQFDAGVGQLVNQVAANYTFANSYVPVIQQLSGLIGLAQQDAATRQQTYPAFDLGVTTFLNTLAANGQLQSAAIQQPLATLASLAANGQTTSPEAQGLLWFLNNVYTGGLSAAPFSGSSVTAIAGTASGAVWFTCANGALGTVTAGQSPLAVTLNGAPVQVSSMTVGSDGTAWFVTTNGQIGYCPVGQTAATADQVASLVVTAPSSASVGNWFSITVTALDAAGKVILDYPGTIQFSSSDPQPSLPPSYTFTNEDEGTQAFWMVLNTSGSQTITVTSGSVSGTATVQVA
jgi:Ca2+-binding RTX toxin-like protein